MKRDTGVQKKDHGEERERQRERAKENAFFPLGTKTRKKENVSG